MRAKLTPEERTARDRARKHFEYERRKAYARDYLGGKCAECGSTEELEFDHVDPAMKRFDLMRDWSVAWQRWHDELEKCQLLCHDDHAEKTARERRDYLARAKARDVANAEVPFDPEEFVEAVPVPEVPPHRAHPPRPEPRRLEVSERRSVGTVVRQTARARISAAIARKTTRRGPQATRLAVQNVR